MKALVVALFGFLALACADHAEAANRRYRPIIRVAIGVAADGGLDAIIKSYLAREFRKFDDVMVADTDPLFHVSCVVLKNQNRGGTHTGYTLSFVITNTMASTVTMDVIRAKLPAEDVEFISKLSSRRGEVVDHVVQTCAPQEVQSVCHELVARFDGRLIENARQLAQSIIDMRTSSAADPETPAAFSGITVAEVTETVDKPKDLRADPLTTSTPSAPTWVVVGLKKGDFLKVRSGPAMSTSEVASLPLGFTGITVVGGAVMNERTEWLPVSFGDQTGWVRSKYLHEVASTP